MSADTTGVPPRTWIALVVISLAQLMVVLDATIVNIALPAASAELDFDATGRQWVVAAYSLAFGSLLLVGGRLGDRIGKFRSFLIGAIGFAVASAVGGWAPTLDVLIAARAGQGVFAAILAPAALGLLTVAFAGSPQRTRAFAIFGAVSGAGAGIGLILGGWLTEYFSWRGTLYINVVFALVAVIGAIAVVPRPRPEGRERFDVRGAVIASVALLGIVYAIATAAARPFVAGIVFVIGIALLVLFVRLQKRVVSPLLPPSILADRRRSTSSLVMLVASTGIVAVFLFATSYLQDVMGFSALLAGLAFLPMVGAIVLGAQLISAGLARHVPLRIKIPAAGLVSAAGMVLLAQVHEGAAYPTAILPGLILTGLGLGVVFADTLSSATLGVGAADSGVASAVLNSAQQIGTSVGVALLTTASGIVVALQVDDGLATIAGYRTVFWIAAAAFVAVALVAVLRYPPELRPTGRGSRRPGRPPLRP